MVQVKAPRSAFLNFPLGRQCGKPDDVELQTAILKDTLEILSRARTPGEIVDLPYEYGEPFDWESYRRDVDEMLNEAGVTLQEWVPKA